eukprot:1872790-Amphidinium_carterae.1
MLSNCMKGLGLKDGLCTLYAVVVPTLNPGEDISLAPTPMVKSHHNNERRKLDEGTYWHQ